MRKFSQKFKTGVSVVAVVVVLLVLGVWMIDRLRAYSRAMACIESGSRSCLKLDVNQSPSR